MSARGRRVDFDWNGRRATAWLPIGLEALSIELSPATIRATERSAALLTAVDQSLPTNWEPLARLLLRSEGIASSSIEGVRAPVSDVALAEMDPTAGDSGWIVDNLAVVESAITSAGDELTVDTLHRWHGDLMGHSPLPAEMIGTFRTQPSWIGGTSPLDAAYVPPPVGAIESLMDDLVACANDTALDPITQAAVVHAQFETIHPYGDGNGRLGRLLVSWIVRRRGVVSHLPPPISVLIARDAGGYLAGLYEFREGSIDRWVRWFADVASAAAHQTDTMIEQVTATTDRWLESLGHLRSDATALRAVRLLPELPVLSAAKLARRLEVSERTARTVLGQLAENGIVHQIDPERPPTRGRQTRWWAATELLDATARWSS